MQRSTPAATAVRETLDRVLASETFGRSERARRLLRYLVEREQAGEADRLKGFSIAMDVFGKDAGFNPATDAVVRVQAGRLRDLLEQYSAAEGVDDALRIVIPRGSYVPAYAWNPVRPPSGQEAPPAAGPSPAFPDLAAPLASIARQFRFVWLACGLIVAMQLVLFAWQSGLLPPAQDGAARATADTLPLVYLAAKDDSPQAGRVAAALRAGLPGFDTVDFIGREAPAGAPARPAPASFVFETLPGAAAGDVALELRNLATDRVLFSRNLTAADTAPGQVEDEVAGILSSTVLASGTIYGYIEQAGIQTRLTRCISLDEAYYQDQNATSHAAAYRCMETLARQDGALPLVYSELSSLQIQAVAEGYAYPPGASVDKATALARKALLKGATSAAAHRAYGFLCLRLGDAQESVRWLRQAYELNAYDLSMAAAYGYGLIFAGRYGEGTPIIARAVAASGAHPTWWDFGLFLGAFMQGETERAGRAASALATTVARPHYLAARLISASASGDDAARLSLLGELVAGFPQFAADPRRAFAERNYPADLADRLAAAPRRAGLGGGN